jgi:hypothetical protein
MHIPTHLLSGWCAANLLPLNARERLGCMIAASAADIDGLGIIFGRESAAYWDYHHKLAHNLPFALLLAGVLAIFATRRMLAFIVYLALAHLHLLMDYFGSGPNWPIDYLWPFSTWHITNDAAWPFYSWQNMAIALSLLAWTIWIAFRRGRTPIELLAPRLDRAFVQWIRSHAPDATSIP